jgi:hypothetical protein
VLRLSFLALIITSSLILSGCENNQVSSTIKSVPEPDYVLTADQTHTKFSRRIAPVIEVPSGSVIEAFTHEATGGQLTIESTGVPPVIIETSCFPPKITVDGTNKSSIFAKFTDGDNTDPTEFTVTFKLRDPDDNEILLVDNN